MKPSPTRATVGRYAPDALIAVLLLVAASLWILHESGEIPQSLFGSYADDVWFEADTVRTLENFTDRFSDHYRTQVHPLSSVILNPYVSVVGKISGGTPLHRVRVAMALLAGLWALSLFGLLRMLRLDRLSAAAFALLGLSGAAYLFWFTVPETYGAGSLTILFVLIGAAFAERRGGISERWLVALNVLSISITVTNWMTGLALAIRTRSWRRTVRVGLITLAITLAFALIQKHYFPSSRIFLWGAGGEGEFINHKGSGSPLDKLRVLLLDSFAAPQIDVVPQSQPFHGLLSVQLAGAGTASNFGEITLGLWIVLLALGCYAAVRALRERRLFASVLLLIIAGQVCLHLVYGEETFLYVLNIFPCLIALAALSTAVCRASIAATVAVVAAGGAFANNQVAWRFACDQIAASSNQREQAQLEKQTHPELPWPRAKGHVLIGIPGSAPDAKSYHEPGGSFSPAPGSFGLSFWIETSDGRFVASSETLPISQVTQRYGGNATHFQPSIETSTPYFHVSWDRDGMASIATLALDRMPAGSELWAVIRSVGPAGGPVTSIVAKDAVAQIGDSWRVSFDQAPEWVGGDEQRAPIALRSGRPEVRVTSRNGWGFVAAKLASGRVHSIRIDQTAVPDAGAFQGWTAQPLWAPKIPDERFTEAARAEQTQLLMGLTSAETRPGDPLNYASDSVRDAAVVVGALARAGQGSIAKALSLKLASTDFFGEYGAEGDAPGLSLWALGEVAGLLHDAAYDASLLQDVRRKIELIGQCLGSGGFVAAEITPRPEEPDDNRPCDRARGGLEVGRMDAHFPILYVNAVSYAGLVAAARLARRAGDQAIAARAEALADPLPRKWLELYRQSHRARVKSLLAEYRQNLPRTANALLMNGHVRARELMIDDNWLHADDDDRTYIAAVWPSWIGVSSESARAIFTEDLGRRWSSRRYEPARVAERRQPFFDVAEAHQWLLLGRADRSSMILRAYFANDVSPGLYAWWEGSGEEHSAHRWANVRGWLDPRGVSPQYRAAAEALALQMDQFTYVNEGTATRTLEIGGGVEDVWLRSALDSGWIFTEYGPVRWQFNGTSVDVQCRCAAAPPLAMIGALKGMPYKLRLDSGSD